MKLTGLGFKHRFQGLCFLSPPCFNSVAYRPCSSCLQVIEVIRHPRDHAESKYNPDVGSKEDEEKYRKIVQENSELQRLIAEVSRGPNACEAEGRQARRTPVANGVPTPRGSPTTNSSVSVRRRRIRSGC